MTQLTEAYEQYLRINYVKSSQTFFCLKHPKHDILDSVRAYKKKINTHTIICAVTSERID